MVLMWCSPGRSGDGYGSIVWDEFTNLRGEKVKFQKNTQLGQPEVHTNGSENHSKKNLVQASHRLRRVIQSKAKKPRPREAQPSVRWRRSITGGFHECCNRRANSNQNSINQLRSENHRAKQEVHIKASPSYALSKKELDLKGEWIVRVGRAA